MQKEVLIAIIFGSLLWLLVAFGVWRANMSLSPDEPEEVISEDIQKKEIVESIIPELSIVSPEPNSVLNEPTVTISGLSSNSKYAIAMTENAESVNMVQNGEFTFEVELEAGLNTIYIFGISDTGDVKSMNVPVIYTTQLNPEENEEESEEDINTRVQERLNEQINPVLSYIGSVTDVTEEYFQIRGQSGEINQLAINEDTTYVSDIQNEKEIEFGDVGIGDFIVAMGRLDENETLNTQRILVTTPPGENNYLVTKGIITDLTRNELSFGDESSATVFRLGANTDYWDISENAELLRTDLDFDNEVLVAGEQNGDTLSARSVFVISF